MLRLQGLDEAPRQFSVDSLALKGYRAGIPMALSSKTLQRKEDAPERQQPATSLKTQTIGVRGDEEPLVLPGQQELKDEWGPDETDFGGDKKVEEFIDKVLERFAQRGVKGDERVVATLASKKTLADEFRRMVKYIRSSREKKKGPGSIQEHKWNWLSAMPSRVDAATTKLPGINPRWAFNPYSVPAPSAEEWQPFPEGIEGGGTLNKVSDAVAAFLVELKKLADKGGYEFRVENRKSHSNGHAVDMYFTKGGEKVKGSNQGFWDPDQAAGFLKLFGEAATAAHVRWHVIYNDPRVAREVNLFYGEQEKKQGHTDIRAKISYGGSYRDKDGIEERYHGPSPLLLHFHLDVIW